jgi:hypothetical protein
MLCQKAQMEMLNPDSYYKEYSLDADTELLSFATELIELSAQFKSNPVLERKFRALSEQVHALRQESVVKDVPSMSNAEFQRTPTVSPQRNFSLA